MTDLAALPKSFTKSDDPSIVFGDDGHAYAATRLPGIKWNIDLSYKILNLLPVKQLTLVQRMFLSGVIAGIIERVAKEGPPR